MSRGATRRAAWAAAVGIVLGSGCSRAPDTGDLAEDDAPSDAAHADAPREDRDPYRLASAIERAKAQPAEAATPALLRLREEWLGERMRWEVAFVPALCRETGPCVALPFDHARRPSSLPQGWLPRLELTPPQREDLARRCAAAGGQCVFAFEATLTGFELGLERPTSLTFTKVELGACRSARPEESWVRRPAATKSTGPSDPHVTLSRTASEAGA